VQIVRDLEDRAAHFVNHQQCSPLPLCVNFAEGRLTISSGTPISEGQHLPVFADLSQSQKVREISPSFKEASFHCALRLINKTGMGLVTGSEEWCLLSRRMI
jgi:hypothetical protein